jgi:hypothetical protein
VGDGVCLKMVSCSVLGSGGTGGPHCGIIVRASDDTWASDDGCSHLALLILVGCDVSHHRSTGVHTCEATAFVQDCCMNRNGHSGATFSGVTGECCGSKFDYNGNYG